RLRASAAVGGGATAGADARTDAEPRPRERRSAWFDGRLHDVAVYELASIGMQRRAGPALLDGTGTTIVVPPGCAFEVTDDGDVLMYAAGGALDEVVVDVRLRSGLGAEVAA